MGLGILGPTLAAHGFNLNVYCQRPSVLCLEGLLSCENLGRQVGLALNTRPIV